MRTHLIHLPARDIIRRPAISRHGDPTECTSRSGIPRAGAKHFRGAYARRGRAAPPQLKHLAKQDDLGSVRSGRRPPAFPPFSAKIARTTLSDLKTGSIGREFVGQ